MKRNSLLIKICLLIVFASSLQACSQVNNETHYKPSGNGTESNTSTSKATSSAATNESKTKKAEFKWDTDTLNNTSGKTLIKCITTPMPKGNHMSFAIVSSKGTVIIAEPNKLNYTNGVFRADVITSSFINHDHTDSSFIRVNSQARVSVQKAESFTAKDVKVTGVAASQSTAPIDPVSPTEVIYLYEVDGLRIVYMGALGQDELTKEQLEQLGKVDIFIGHFNHAPAWNIKKETTAKVIQQLQPHIVLASEYSPEPADFILKEVGIKERKEQEQLLVDLNDLKDIKEMQYYYLQ